MEDPLPTASQQLWSDPDGKIRVDKAVKDIIIFSGLIRNGRGNGPTFLERTIQHGAQTDPIYWETALPLIRAAFIASTPEPDEEEGFARIEAAILRGLHGTALNS